MISPNTASTIWASTKEHKIQAANYVSVLLDGGWKWRGHTVFDLKAQGMKWRWINNMHEWSKVGTCNPMKEHSFYKSFEGCWASSLLILISTLSRIMFDINKAQILSVCYLLQIKLHGHPLNRGIIEYHYELILPVDKGTLHLHLLAACSWSPCSIYLFGLTILFLNTEFKVQSPFELLPKRIQ